MNTTNIVICSIVTVIVLILICYYIIKAIKNGWIKKIYDQLKAAVKEAETTQLKGEAKKAYVLEKLEKACEDLGILYKLIKKMLSTLIDKIIEYYNIISK